MLFPVRLVPYEVMRDWEYFDGDTGKDSAREVREYFIPDFSKWKEHDSYQASAAAVSERSESSCQWIVKSKDPPKQNRLGWGTRRSESSRQR